MPYEYPPRRVAVLCPDCKGSGDIITSPNSPTQRRRWDCDTCRTIGYILTDEEC